MDELPVEPGIYCDAEGDAWKLDEDGWWFGANLMDPPVDYGPMVRLTPEQ